jgi:hypothetical protein
MQNQSNNDYQQLKDWIEYSIKEARDILYNQKSLTLQSYESLYNALIDLADWCKMETLYD